MHIRRLAFLGANPSILIKTLFCLICKNRSTCQKAFLNFYRFNSYSLLECMRTGLSSWRGMAFIAHGLNTYTPVYCGKYVLSTRLFTLLRLPVFCMTWKLSAASKVVMPIASSISRDTWAPIFEMVKGILNDVESAKHGGPAPTSRQPRGIVPTFGAINMKYHGPKQESTIFCANFA